MASSEDIIPESSPTSEGPTVVDDAASYYDSMMQVSNEIFTNPLNLVLLSISAFLLYKILSGRQAPRPRPEPEVEMPRMKKKDMLLEELKLYNGTNEDGRICIAVNGRVYDVTLGKQFYGPGGPYSIFAGRDASRALALFTVSESALKSEDDDLSDLTSGEMNRMREWQIQLEEKYDFVGRLLKPGQEPADYTDSEDEMGNPNDEADNPSKETPEEKGIEEVELTNKTSQEISTTEKDIEELEELEVEEPLVDLDDEEKKEEIEEKKPEKEEKPKEPEEKEKVDLEEIPSTKKTEL